MRVKKKSGKRHGLLSISGIRRKELCVAAFEVLQTEGIAATTLEKVAARAGASKGIVLHYFGTKHCLLEHTMRYINGLLRDDLVERLKNTRSAEERLWAIVETNFAPQFFQPSTCHAWLVLCAEVPNDKQYRRVQRAIYARMRSNLLGPLKSLLPADQVEEVMTNITGLIDGFYLRAGLQLGDISRENARDYVAQYLLKTIPALSGDYKPHRGA